MFIWHVVLKGRPMHIARFVFTHVWHCYRCRGICKPCLLSKLAGFTGPLTNIQAQFFGVFLVLEPSLYTRRDLAHIYSTQKGINPG